MSVTLVRFNNLTTVKSMLFFVVIQQVLLNFNILYYSNNNTLKLFLL